MRLLLDEHMSPAIARALRARGHDVVAIADDARLRGLDDVEILAAAASERRVIVTQDVRDFILAGRQRLPDGTWHAGIVLASSRAFPPSIRALGTLVDALDRLLSSRGAGADISGQVVWLASAEGDD